MLKVPKRNNIRSRIYDCWIRRLRERHQRRLARKLRGTYGRHQAMLARKAENRFSVSRALANAFSDPISAWGLLAILLMTILFALFALNSPHTHNRWQQQIEQKSGDR